jgi:hypothetical protein
VLTSRLAKPGSVLERPADTPCRAHHQDGAVGVADHRVGDVTHEGASHPTEPAAADHYHAGVDILGKMHDRLIPLFIHLHVGDRHGATGLFYLPDLFVEYLLGLFPEIVAAGLGILVVDSGRKRAPDRNDVQSRARALGEIYRYLGRQIRVRRTVGSQ